VVQEDPLILQWTDATTFETEFQVEVSFGGSPFIPYAAVRSTTSRGTGTTYSVTTGSVPYNTDYRFRVRAVSSDTGQQSSWSQPSDVCRTPGLDPHLAGCLAGQIYLQSRSDHSGAAVYYHGFPVAQTDSVGRFRICGVPAGNHVVGSRATGYLETRLDNASAIAGRTMTLPFAALRGGDVNNDALINLFDLVRVGADYGSAPPTDAAADCNADGRVSLFDLVMVGANYGLRGPTRWGDDLSSRQALAGAGAPTALVQRRWQPQGVQAGRPLELGPPRSEDDVLVVPVRVRGAAHVYGFDVTLAYDPARVMPVDAAPADSGTQLRPGDAWSPPEGYVVRNTVDTGAAVATFAASRLKPFRPVSGDVVLVEMRFRPLSADTTGAVVIAGAALSDARGRPIDVRWSGVDLFRLFHAYLPAVATGLGEP
jgi:hypothetical protein